MATRFIRHDWAVCHCDVVKHGVLTHVGETRRYRNDHYYICIMKNIYLCCQKQHINMVINNVLYLIMSTVFLSCIMRMGRFAKCPLI